MITKPPLDLVKAGVTSGKVESSGHSLSVIPDDSSIATTLDGHFDPITGTMILSIPDYPVLKIQGFMTQASIKEGKEGTPGTDGRVGVNGMLGEDGDQGTRGCRGPEGLQGRPGQRGPRGQLGAPGQIGPTGAKGIQGDPGVLKVYIQAEDPGDVGAGAIWVKK